MLRILIFLTLAFIAPTLHAQPEYTTLKNAPEKAQKYFNLGMDMLYNKRPEQALRYFDKALNIRPDFIDAQIFKAGAMTQTDNWAEAEKGFEAVLNIAPEYDMEVYYDLGMVKYHLKKYGEAGLLFQKYLDSDPKNERRKSTALEFIEKTRFMTEYEKKPFDFHPQNLGPNINNAGDQYLPALTADGNTLIYSAVVGGGYGQEDFFQSKKENGVWQKGTPLSAVNTENSEGAHTISADGHLLIFTACNRKSGFGSCDLFYSEYDCGEWSPVQVIPPPVSTGAWESQPSLSADGKKLYFASNRPGGIGEKDLWVAERQADGSWGTPQNLGAGINTPKDEKAPFIHPDGQTLYFLSSGHPGLGFEDLFICRKQPDGSWGAPQNFGYPINTENSEGPIFVSLDGKQAYFSSNRTDFEEAYGKMDIYTFELPPHLRPQPVTYVKATVRDEKDNRPLVARVEFVDLMTGKSYVQNQTDCDGVFLVTLPSGKNYMLNINRDGYFFYSDHFELSAGGSFDDPYLLDVRLRPIPSQNASTDLADAAPGAPIILKNVFFETGSAELKPESLIELNRLKALLEAHPDLKIQINGHTDHVGTEEDNLKLSNDRAKAVYDYLIQNGIQPERLRYKGFGESRPIDTNDTEAGRRNNRRTEFEVIATK